MKALIIGCEGFIGSYCTAQLLSAGYEVIGCDLFETAKRTNYRYHKVSRLSPQWDEIFSSHQFEVCINAAGSGNVPYSMKHPLIDFESNTLDVIRILDAIRKHNSSCKYLHISSAAVYGNPDFLPVDEQARTHPLSAYGWHKLMSEQVCAEYHQVYNINTAVMRPFSVYGEGLRKQLLWDICTKLQQQDEIELFGTGSESRDFIHCSDLAKLIFLVVNKAEFKGEVYNAASGIETSIRSIAQFFEQFYNEKKKIHFSGEQRQGDPQNWRANISKISKLDFSISVSLEEGVKAYAQWFHTQQ